MDFLNQQPHPEVEESACIRCLPNVQPLQPAVETDALLCAGAYVDERYRLLVTPADDPKSIELYSAEEITCFQNDGLRIRCSAEIRSLSFLLKPGDPLICAFTDKVVFFDLRGIPRTEIRLDARSATACWMQGNAYLVTDREVCQLTEDLRPIKGASWPIEARPCRVDNRTDVLWKTGRRNPGTTGGMLYCLGTRTFYVCGDIFRRCAWENRDTFACEVFSLNQPFSRRYLIIPNGGAACLFTGRDGQTFAAFVGSTELSCVYRKASVLPMEMASGQFLRPLGDAYLETVPSSQLKPVQGIRMLRDSFIFAAPDGCYYLTGTSQGESGSHLSDTSAIRLWRSRDLNEFEPLGVVYDYRTKPDSWQNHISRNRNSWAPEITFHAGTYWITYSTSPGCGLLKSVSGKPEGPYQDMGRVVHRGIDSGFFLEGDAWYLIWQNGKIAPLSDDGREMLEEPVLLLPTDGQEVGYEGAGLIKVGKKYVLYGAEWNGDFRIDGSYDMMYSVAEQLMGPYSPRRCLIPHGGHSCLFYDHDGILRYTIFGNDRTAPFRRSLGIGRIEIREQNGSLSLHLA